MRSWHNFLYGIPYTHMPLFRVWRCVSVFYQKSANSAYFVLLQRRIPAQKGLKFFMRSKISAWKQREKAENDIFQHENSVKRLKMTTFRLKMTTFVTDSLFFLFVSANPRIFWPISPNFLQFQRGSAWNGNFFYQRQKYAEKSAFGKGKKWHVCPGPPSG